MVGSIREAEKGFHCILYARIHKIHREHGWAYLACKKFGRITKQAEDGMKLWNCTVHKGIKETGVGIRYKVIIRVIDDTGSASLLLFDDLVFKLTSIKCYTLLNEYGLDYDDYFLMELNNMVGKTMLFCFQYSDYNINNNHHVYQVQKIAEDQTMIEMFKKDFLEQGAGSDVQTPLLKSGSSSKFSSSDIVPFNIEETPKSKGVAASEGKEKEKVRRQAGAIFSIFPNANNFQFKHAENTDHVGLYAVLVAEMSWVRRSVSGGWLSSPVVSRRGGMAVGELRMKAPNDGTTLRTGKEKEKVRRQAGAIFS
ncbi:replication protein A 70 kDa DNA-binding subunit B, partial [Tanacetum coccineum]